MKKSRYLLFLLTALLLSGCGNQNKLGDEHQITFESNGGSYVESLVARTNEQISAPADPVFPGYSFSGWYVDNETFANKYTFNKMPDYDFTLYAKWSVISAEEVAAYQNTLRTMSKPNHLYIHYLRFTNTPQEYEAWDMWIWPESSTGRIVEFMKDKDGKVYVDKYGGAVVELDLAQTYNDGGHDGNGNKTSQSVNYMPDGELVRKIGFLITFKTSRTAGTHWTSDGGDKFLNTSEALENGFNDSLHVFAVQDNVKDFTYKYAGQMFDNPYLFDDGTNVSLPYNNVNSSATPTNIAKMSGKLREIGVGYQIMVSSFADSDGDGLGDIRGIINNFDYFLDLNVESIWLTPVQLSDSYHGYDTIDYMIIDPKFGSASSPHAENGEVTFASAHADYVDLLNLAADNNITIVMDLVINHTSINNVLFQESLSLDPAYRAYYHWRNHQEEALDAKVWHPYSTYDYSFYGKFASSMPELNYDYQATRDKMFNIMDYWVTLGVGGFRIDAVKHAYMEEEIIPSAGDTIISDYDEKTSQNYNSNLTKNLHLFKELNARLKAKHPDVYMFGENFDGHSYHVAPYFAGLDSMLNFYMFYNLAVSVRKGKDNGNHAATVSGAVGHGSDNFSATRGDIKYGGAWNYRGQLETMNKYQNNGSAGLKENNVTLNVNAIDSLFTSNHDLPRTINQVIGDYSGNNITKPNNVANNNRNEAEKMSLTMLAATLLLPGQSWIYYGDELGMSSNLPSGTLTTSPHADRYARQPFKWAKARTESTTVYSFSGAQTYHIEWDSDNTNLNGVAEQSTNANSMLSKVKELTALKNKEVFKTGSIYFFNEGHTNLRHFSNNKNVFAFERELGADQYQVFINMSGQNVTLVDIDGTLTFNTTGTSLSKLAPWGIAVTKL